MNMSLRRSTLTLRTQVEATRGIITSSRRTEAIMVSNSNTVATNSLRMATSPMSGNHMDNNSMERTALYLRAVAMITSATEIMSTDSRDIVAGMSSLEAMVKPGINTKIKEIMSQVDMEEAVTRLLT